MRPGVDGVLLARLQEELHKIADLERQLQRLMVRLEEMQRQGQVQEDLKKVIEDLKELKKEAEKKAEKIEEKVVQTSSTPSLQLDKDVVMIAGAVAAGTITGAVALYKWCMPFQQHCTAAWNKAKQGASKAYTWLKEHKAVTAFVGGAAVSASALGGLWYLNSSIHKSPSRK